MGNGIGGEGDGIEGTAVMPCGKACGGREEWGMFVEGEEQDAPVYARGDGGEEGCEFLRGVVSGKTICEVETIHIAVGRREWEIAEQF